MQGLHIINEFDNYYEKEAQYQISIVAGMKKRMKETVRKGEGLRLFLLVNSKKRKKHQKGSFHYFIEQKLKQISYCLDIHHMYF